jgi:hypothetical protein
MKLVDRYQTSDGVIHDTLDDAKKHATERWGNFNLDLSKKFLSHKASKVPGWLDENLDDLIEKLNKLKALRDDRESLTDDRDLDVDCPYCSH